MLEDGERTGLVTLQPLNSDYDPIVITGDEDDVAVVAELVDVLNTP